MKKFLTYSVIALAIVILIPVGVFQFFSFKNNQDIEQTENIIRDEGLDITVQEFKEQTAKVQEIEFDTGLALDSSIDEVMEVMHRMSHQKVRANEKWGAIPMTEKTINQVLYVLESKNSKSHLESGVLLDIARKWQKGDFSNADEDHNTIWLNQGGTIGKAYGLMSRAEEAEYIKNNFENN